MAYAGDPEIRDGDQQTPFRQAEKKYQLHRVQQMVYKRGRVRGGKLQEVPTDFSEVVDLHDSAVQDDSGMQLHQLSNGLKAYTLTSHPGLLILPGAVPHAQQVELACDAVRDYPNPPARTNHSLAYGPLPGIWSAAQQGLRLNWSRRDDPHAGPPRRMGCGMAGQAHAATATTACGQQQQPLLQEARGMQQQRRAGCGADTSSSSSCIAGAGDGAAGAGVGDPDAACSVATPRQSYDGSECGAAGDGCRTGSACSSGGASEAVAEDAAEWAATAADQETASAAPPPPPSFEQCWGADGSGPTAAQLFHKLRWASLGPHYDWTQRLYDVQSAHRRLPATLQRVAQQMVDAVHSLAGVAGLPQGMGGHVSYRPDAAIVNYYREGDVLGGHRDDVEPDMSQPIVSLSLGCEAVFLLGGHTRNTAPTALRLCSGDVVILAGEARCCYHGVPRIRTGTSTLSRPVDGRDPDPDTLPFVRHMDNARINISIRTVAAAGPA